MTDVHITINFNFDKETKVAYDTNVRGDVNSGDTTEDEDEPERRRMFG